MKKILQQVLERVVPSKKENIEEKRMARELEQKIMQTGGKHVSVQLLGSLSRGTHLRGDRDLDLFVFFPKKLSRKEFEKEGLRIGKKILKGHFWEEAYSEHPYVRGNYKGFEVEIVPTYQIKGIHEMQSSVDRTPFHYKYLQKRLKAGQKNEVRLLKQFLKGMGAYGADTRYNSLSGYATELLILQYKTFAKTLQAMAHWKPPVLIDLEKYWHEKALREKFPQSCLILVDPTDAERNVASAVSSEQMQRISKAAKAFLKKPGIAFFFPAELSEKQTRQWLQKATRKKILAIQTGYPAGALNDIVWGQLKKLAKKTREFLEQYEFKVKRSEGFTDEKKVSIILVELEQFRLPKTRVRMGPFLEDTENVKRFLKAHPGTKPRFKNGRAWIGTSRKIVFAGDCLQLFLKQASEKPPLEKALKRKKRVLEPKAIAMEAQKNKDLSRFVVQFVQNKPY